MNHHVNRPGDPRPAATPSTRPLPAPAPPRKVRGGLRLEREMEELRRDYRASRWIMLAERSGGDDTFNLGLAYAIAGQALSLDAGPGRIVASVQGARRSPYQVTIEFPTWDESDWQRAIEVIGREPSLFADVLVGDASQRLCAALERGGLHLLPTRDETVQARCECASKSRCKHIAAAIILAAQKSINEPAFLTLVRGLSMAALVDRLQQERGIEARGAVPAHPEPGLDVLALAAAPLEESIESFWTSVGEPRDAERPAGPHHVSHALLRRLGPSALPGRFPIVGLLASIYDAVSERAKSMQDEV